MLAILLQTTLCQFGADTAARDIAVDYTCAMNLGRLELYNKRVLVDLSLFEDTFSLLGKTASIVFDNITFEISGSTAHLALFNLVSAEVASSILRNVTIHFNEAAIDADEIHLFQQTFLGNVSYIAVYGSVALNCNAHAAVFHKFYGYITGFISQLEIQSTCPYHLIAMDFQQATLSNIAVYDYLNLIGVGNYYYINVFRNNVAINLYYNAMTVRSSKSVDLTTTSQLLSVVNYIDSYSGYNAKFTSASFQLADLETLVAPSLAELGSQYFFWQDGKIYNREALKLVSSQTQYVVGSGQCTSCLYTYSCSENSQLSTAWKDFVLTSITQISCVCLKQYSGVACEIAPPKQSGGTATAWIVVVVILAVLCVGLAVALTLVLLQKKKSGPTEVIELNASAASRPYSGKKVGKLTKSQAGKTSTPRTTSAYLFYYESSSISPARFDSSVDGPRSISVIKYPKEESAVSPASFNAVRKAASKSEANHVYSDEDDASYMEEGPVVDLDKM